jgi:hypothetical protein
MYNALASLYSDLPGYEIEQFGNVPKRKKTLEDLMAEIGLDRVEGTNRFVNPQTQLNNDLTQIQAPQITSPVNPETQAKLQLEIAIAKAKNDPLYKQFQADPLSADRNMRNANAIVAGLQSKLNKVSNENENPYKKFLTDQFKDMQSRNYATGWSGSTDEENEARRKQLYDVVKQLGDIYTTEQATKASKELKEMEFGKDIKVEETKAKAQVIAEEIKSNKSTGKPLLQSEIEKLRSLDVALNKLNSLSNEYQKEENKDLFGGYGALRRVFNDLTRGVFDAKGNLYNQNIGMLKKQIAKAHEGGRMSDKDWEIYNRMLFNPNASQEDFVEALMKYRTFLDDEVKYSLELYEDAGRDVSGFTNQSGQSTQGAEDTVRNFNSEEEAQSAGLQPGTIITINGRKAVWE